MYGKYWYVLRCKLSRLKKFNIVKHRKYFMIANNNQHIIAGISSFSSSKVDLYNYYILVDPNVYLSIMLCVIITNIVIQCI